MKGTSHKTGAKRLSPPRGEGWVGIGKAESPLPDKKGHRKGTSHKTGAKRLSPSLGEGWVGIGKVERHLFPTKKGTVMVPFFVGKR